MKNNILVTGATGNIGSYLIPRLLETPEASVQALVRDQTRCYSLADAGVALKKGAFEDAESLGNAMQGIDVVVLIAPAGSDCVAQNESIISAAAAARVKKIVRISAIKAAEDGRTKNTRLHGTCDQLLMNSGLDYVILRPNYFMQNIFMSLDGINANAEFAAGMGEGKLAMIDVRDVAEAACVAATSEQFDKQVFELSGPASISFHDVADAISDAAGRQISYIAVSPDEVKATLLSYGFDEWMAELLREYSAAYGDGWGDLVTENVELLTGRRPRSFDQFANEVLKPALV